MVLSLKSTLLLLLQCLCSEEREMASLVIVSAWLQHTIMNEAYSEKPCVLYMCVLACVCALYMWVCKYMCTYSCWGHPSCLLHSLHTLVFEAESLREPGLTDFAPRASHQAPGILLCFFVIPQLQLDQLIISYVSMNTLIYTRIMLFKNMRKCLSHFVSITTSFSTLHW